MDRLVLRNGLGCAIAGVLILAAGSAHAQNSGRGQKCADGGLVFLGKTSDSAKSVWLSRTGIGSFALSASNAGVVDTWSRERRGLHVSMSPEVSNGNGLPHSLIDTIEDCEIAKVNQKGGITFPPGIKLPPKLPPVLRSPGGRPPTGLMPTLPTAPPTGVMPTLPTAPPTGVMPTLPTAPPAAVMPTMPTAPPTGVMPTLPTAPPTGVTPTLPTAPPTGVMPTLPTAPPTGVMPTLPTQPSAVTPPVVVIPGVVPNDLEGPYTRGREFVVAPAWNFWVDGRATDISDERYGLDLNSEASQITMGADHQFGDDLVFGLMTTLEKNQSDGFNRGFAANSKGWPSKINLDGNAATHRALLFLRRQDPRWQSVVIRSRRYLNNVVE